MALFVDLDDEDIEPPQQYAGGKVLWSSSGPSSSTNPHPSSKPTPPDSGKATESTTNVEEAHESAATEFPNWNSMTEALGCYPVAAAIASSIDLNTLDSLSRTCRQIRAGLLQFRKPLLASTLHCCNEDLPVDGEETLRYRARAGNLYYMEDTSRTSSSKSGQCARDMVSECRRCGTVVCRNCVIKPPASVVLRDRHRRLCNGCCKAPLTQLTKPHLPANTPLHSETMQRALCVCATEVVWLCQPCGRSIRADDNEYMTVWKWRNQYGDVIGGLGTGIGDGDRGVICGREDKCCCAKERAQEMDCDAEDARDAEYLAQGSYFGSAPGSPAGSASGSSLSSLVSASSPPSTSPWTLPVAPATQAAVTVGSPLYSPEVAAALESRRTPSPAHGPGYARHEVEGIGGVVKRTRVKMVRVGACVHDWDDELTRGLILDREITGRARSWCGWCRRPIPSQKDIKMDGLSSSPNSPSP